MRLRPTARKTNRRYGLTTSLTIPNTIPRLGQWLLEQWGPILGDETAEARIEKLQTHLNRDKLPIAWVAHRNGELMGSAALRVHDLEGHEDLTPWLGGVIVGARLRRQGVGETLCKAVEDYARARSIETLYLFTLDKQAWYPRLGWSTLRSCAWHESPAISCGKIS